MSVRQPTHAGTWYSDDGDILRGQLDHWLDQVPDHIEGLGTLPIQGSRIIIAPHAGYAYSGPCAAFAYKSLDLSLAKRIFLIGPSHHEYMRHIALSEFDAYATPLSDEPLRLDTELIAHLKTTRSATQPQARFESMSHSVDEAEHSLELHLPYIHRMLQRHLPSAPVSSYPPLVPMIVGSTSAAAEQALGSIIAPYLDDPGSIFIISSDFCHWGTRFSYTYYLPHTPFPKPALPLSYDKLPQPAVNMSEDSVKQEIASVSSGRPVRHTDTFDQGGLTPEIHDSISACDVACMKAIAYGDSKLFLQVLQNTGNTVCGRHPIGVILSALEQVLRVQKPVEDEGDIPTGRFYFIRYERSSEVTVPAESSVSYVSAFATL
ncbi:hypothetical protein FQN57_005302 [Myotisia sp. PD_48]|nr:hypothetical protein FQN57_005302 [Myotisia sp. PD_48]